jgi:hypothetical protein
VRDLLLLFHQIQTLGDRWVVLVLVLPDLLAPLRDGSLVEDGAKPLKDGVVRFWAVLGEEEADLAHEADGDFDGVVGGAIQTQQQDLQGDNLVCDVLVDEVGDECGRGVADGLHERVSNDSRMPRASGSLCGDATVRLTLSLRL